MIAVCIALIVWTAGLTWVISKDETPPKSRDTMETSQIESKAFKHDLEV